MSDAALDALDLAGGMVIGSVPDDGSWAAPGRPEHPLTAIEGVVLDGLLRPPCMVSFSGGRDSSALLAVAADLADREGLPSPIPITARFAVEETDETEWQQLVIAHLGIDEWIRVDLADDLDLLGPLGRDVLGRHGLRYPQNAHFHDPLLCRAEGGSLISGAGGDELFEPHRWARAALVLDRAVPIRRTDALVLGAAFAPWPLRARLYHRGQILVPDWMRPAGRRALLRRSRRWIEGDRVRYDNHLEWWRRSRYLNHGQHTFQLLADDHDVQFLAPFSEDRVLRSLAADRGRAGFTSRRAALEHVFGHLLPPALLERQSKATFLRPLVGPDTRALARTADPSGVVAEEWVDPVALAGAWQREHVDIRSLLALQAWWLAAHGSDSNGSTARS